jgi:hypothetical protein
MRAQVSESAISSDDSASEDEAEEVVNVAPPAETWSMPMTRESSVCKVREAMREYYYPRSDPRAQH